MGCGHDREGEQGTKGFTAVGMAALMSLLDLVEFYFRDKNPVFIKDMQGFRQLSTARRGLGKRRHCRLAILDVNDPRGLVREG
jgi:hypothetical protein